MTNKYYVLLALLVLSTGLLFPNSTYGSNPTSNQQPNIVFFLVDDMGWQDTSEPFLYDNNGNEVVTPLNQRYRTPNMEAFADRGMKFTNAYATPVCSPSRTSLMTGKNSARHTVTNWINWYGKETGQGDISSHQSPSDWGILGLAQSEITLPSILQNAGYRTIHVGKGHFGSTTYAQDPANIGFDVNIAGTAHGAPGEYIGDYGKGTNREVLDIDEYHNSGEFLTEVLTLKMNDAIEDAVNDNKPFFAYMSQYAVHTPFTDDPRFVNNYQNLPEEERKYATLVEGMDKSLGDIITKLEQLGVAENTLVIFMSDNGGDAPHADENESNAPLRFKKGGKYEGGFRVPLMVAWASPNNSNTVQNALQIPQGSVEDDIVSVVDMFPTIANITSAPYNHSIDGVDLSPYFRADPGAHREQNLFIHFPHDHRSEYYTIYREGDWKLIYNYVSDDFELYNLANDLSETTNLYNSQPDRVMQMARKMAQQLDETDAQWPEFSNGQDDPFSMPNLPNVDVDGDGIPDNVEDPNFNGLVDAGETDPDVPDNGACTVGASCNDGDACTTGDVYDTNCNCVGTNNGNRGTTSTASLNPVADAFVRGSSYANTNYGNSAELLTKFVGNDKYHRKSYLKFDLSAYNASDLVSATLELKVVNNSANNTSQNLFHVQDDSWTETGISWNNQPGSASLINSFSAPVTGQSVSIDITTAAISALNENNILSLKIEGTNNQYIRYASREQASSAPQLILTIGGDCDDAPCPDGDNDGICDADDNTNGNCTLNAACNDGDSCTTNDQYDANCNCVGTPSNDSDNDGICDINDNTNGNCTLNATCDDGDACTTGDSYDANCNCTGTPAADSDNDGICDANDNTNGNCTLNATCDDGDACTTGDSYDANCNCVGTPAADSDNDGICDANDNTNGNCTLNATCDDGDACTTNDSYDANCNCNGTPAADSDNDGICDANDNTNGNCTLNASCDDGDACTTGETYDANCKCTGGVSGANNTSGLLNPTDDTFIRGGTYSSNNYGNSTTIHIKKGGNDKWTRYGYLKFDLSQVDANQLQNAKLRLKISSNNGTNVAQELLTAPNDNWTEGNLTWDNNQFGGSSISNFTAPAAGQWVEIDVTNATQTEANGDDVISFAITSNNNKYVKYHTKESNGNEPELVLTYQSCGNNRLGKIDGSEIKIYPNPTYDFLNIDLLNVFKQTESDKEVNVKIYSTDGKLIMQKVAVNTTLQIDVQDLPSNQYYLMSIEIEGTKLISNKFLKL